MLLPLLYWILKPKSVGIGPNHQRISPRYASHFSCVSTQNNNDESVTNLFHILSFSIQVIYIKQITRKHILWSPLI
jgi:hypothetical protein